jgi:hypothetical protein
VSGYPRDVSRRARAVSDTLAIVVFATLGQISHRHGVSATGYAEDALPLLAGWFGAARLSGYRFLPTWLGGITAGVALRMVILSHFRGGEAAFWLVTLVVVGALALAMRAVARTATGRRTARSPQG